MIIEPNSIEAHKTLVFVELPNQINAALRAVRRRRILDYTLVALTPHVEYELEKIGHPYRRPEDYHSEEDINSIGLEDFSYLDRFCTTVDSFLQARWDFLREQNIRPARWNWYYLKNLTNTLSIRSFILRRIFENEKPQLVFYFGTREEKVNRNLSFTNESAWSRMIALGSNSFSISTEIVAKQTNPSAINAYSDVHQPGSQNTFKKTMRRLLSPEVIRLIRSNYTRAKLLKRRFTSAFRGKKHRSHPTVMVLDTRYNLQHLIAEIEIRDSFGVFYWDVINRFPPIYLNSPGTRTNAQANGPVFSTDRPLIKDKDLWAAVNEILKQSDLTHLSGIDCFPALERRLKYFFEVTIPQMVNTYIEARTLLQNQACFAVLAAVMGDSAHQAVAAAAKKENVPFIVSRHGDSAGHVWTNCNPTYAHARSLMYVGHNELRVADYVLAFGEGDVKFLESTQGATAKIVAVGSSALDCLKAPAVRPDKESLALKYGLRIDKKTVLYVPTSMEGNMRIAPYRSRSPSRAFYIEKQFVDVFAEFPNIQFVVKLHCSASEPCSPIAQLIRDRHLENCVISTEPFVSMIPMADMFITDYPSTTFFEMLTTDRPILVCGHDLPKKFNPEKWHPSNLDMWKERVVYADDLDEFLNLFRTHLKEERFQAVRSEDTLLRLFGTHLNDCKSAERAHAFLENLATQHAVI